MNKMIDSRRAAIKAQLERDDNDNDHAVPLSEAQLEAVVGGGTWDSGNDPGFIPRPGLPAPIAPIIKR